MRTYNILRAIKIAAVPVLFSVLALGLATVHLSLQRKAERARNRAVLAAAVQDRIASDKTIGLKLPELAAAAGKGELPAQIEMARRLATGQGIKKNEGQAVLYFQAAIKQAGDIAARDKRASLVATAYRYMALFHRRGVPEANIAANPAYAFGLLHHAASYFGDPVAQFELARVFMNGDGVTKNTRAAAQWLLNASRKGYAPAQAQLGEMFWRGNGVKRVPGEGLGLLAIARRNASPDDKVWVSKMFEAARAQALPIEILEANAFIVQESGASSREVANGHLIGGDNQPVGEAPSAGSAVAVPPAAQGGQQSSIVHGISPFPSDPMRANPMNFTSEPYVGELNMRRSDSKAWAGIIQMYRLGETEARTEDAGPVRLAGVTK